MTNYKTLEAWKKSMELVKDVYAITKTYPSDEKYALISQTKRAAFSIPINIAEGMGRNYKGDTIQFLYVARGSIYELETLLDIAVANNILKQESFDLIEEKMKECAKILNGLISYYERSDLKAKKR